MTKRPLRAFCTVRQILLERGPETPLRGCRRIVRGVFRFDNVVVRGAIVEWSVGVTRGNGAGQRGIRAAVVGGALDVIACRSI